MEKQISDSTHSLMMSPTSTIEPSTLEYALFLCSGRSVASPNDSDVFHYSIMILDQAGTVISFGPMKNLRSDNF